jgi:cytochrome c biogenesis protein CcmG/thiol:disulfide interchange protein DsbE
VNHRRLFVAAAVLLPALVVLALLAYGFTWEPRSIESPIVGRPAPGFALTLFDGRTVQLEDFRGKVIFVNFWASRRGARRAEPRRPCSRSCGDGCRSRMCFFSA